APFTVLDGTSVLTNIAVNQRQAPADVTDGGRGWKSLGIFSISSGTLALRLSNNDANDTVTADAIRVVLVSSSGNQPPVAANDSASTTANAPVTVSVLDNDIDPDGDKLSVASVTQPANGTAVINVDNTITYTPAAGFTGSDTFSYTASDGRGGTAPASVTVTVASTSPVEWVVNVGDAGYAETGDRWVSGWGIDSAGDRYRNASPVDAAWATPSTATWTVAGLAPGTYQVYATWVQSPYVATNAPFSVLDGSKTLANLAVNEQAAPSDVTDGGRGWKSLGTFTISSGTLAVQLSNNGPNDTVTADAIRIVRVS
ncbi:MAG: Ig-like domain-containing protein, partial [Candidatus Saccharimonadales bacterium]